MAQKIKVAELFAGVGGFRYAFEKSDKDFFETVYANQYEPSTKRQYSFEVYEANYGKSNDKQFHDNTDIQKVNDILKENKDYIKDSIDLVVGGFPCQDYSVATTGSKGLVGKKGVLFWEIEKFLIHTQPKYLFLENVDRLLISPKAQRGRDFLIMLHVLNKHNYIVEWSVINAGDYGFAQKRKRVMIFAYKEDTNIGRNVSIERVKEDFNQAIDFTTLTKNLNIQPIEEFQSKDISGISLKDLSDSETFNFKNYGFIKDNVIWTTKVKPVYTGTKTILEDILVTEGINDYILSEDQKDRIFKLKDGSRQKRITKDGFEYFYVAGAMSRFDNRGDRPGRTMLTSEGSINRSSHIIKIDEDTYRFITPIEAERLNGFPDDWTSSTNSIRKRYFMMGNALVTGVIQNIGKAIRFYETQEKERGMTNGI